MRKIYVGLVALVYCTGLFSQSSWFDPVPNYKSFDIISDKAFSCHDILNNTLYAIDSDGLYAYNLNTLEQTHNLGKAPSDYTGAWVSFVKADPSGKKIWVGYTTGGLTNDRIYSVNIATDEWKHVASFPGNFDMEIYDGMYFVTGLNKEGWDGTNDINSICLLDTTGNNQHQKIIEVGGNSSGLAIDSKGNIYTAKYNASGTETYMYQWPVDSIDLVLDKTKNRYLTVASGTLISSMPNNGPYDCDVDDADHLLFNCNDFVGGSFLAIWDGNTGDAHNYSKVGGYGGSSFAWFATIKAKGDISKDGEAYMINYGDPLVKIIRNTPPETIMHLGIISAFDDAENRVFDLQKYFNDPDDTDPIVYEIVSNSNEVVAGASLINDTLLVIDFLAAGQTNMIVKATSNGLSVTEKLIVGVQPKIEGDYVISDFTVLLLASDSYWDGSDGSGGFESGLVKFNNENLGWAWTGWAYSNKTDTSTAGYENQFSTITGAGFNDGQSTNSNYGVGYISSDWTSYEAMPSPLTFTDKRSHIVKGLYITNSTYAALSMEHGNDFAKKFGGEDGNDPDYLKIFVWGVKAGLSTDSIEYYLADFRYDDNSKDYIIKTWQWLDLSSLGAVDTLFFSIASSDIGDFGMNTPSYFNIDNIYISPNNNVGFETGSLTSVKVYPNPTSEWLRIESEESDPLNISIYDMRGRLVYSNSKYISHETIDMTGFSDGTYIVKVNSKSKNHIMRIIKNRENAK